MTVTGLPYLQPHGSLALHAAGTEGCGPTEMSDRVAALQCLREMLRMVTLQLLQNSL